MISWYRVILALHLVAVISWMAGQLYLWRLFVYHAEESETVVKDRFTMMEEKLLRIITLPAMYASLGLGGGMLYLNPVLLQQHWMQGKLFFAALMIAVTFFAAKVRVDFVSGVPPKQSRYYRIWNEIPTLLMIFIVFLVIVRPF